ncbi:MAG: hypothetical protein K9I71_13215 [Ignavibacteriales bacterium]|nr:hypothetical protein [Ignavibacteriales bacterium]MCF8438669.1 hypothetical protein [Ignavibacteriales bacterium]
MISRIFVTPKGGIGDAQPGEGEKIVRPLRGRFLLSISLFYKRSMPPASGDEYKPDISCCN